MSDGGFGVCMAECCLGAGLGARVELPGDPAVSPAARLFSEEPTRVVVSFAPEQLERVRMVCEAHEVPWGVIGEVGGASLLVEGVLEVPAADLAVAHHRALEPIVGA